MINDQLDLQQALNSVNRAYVRVKPDRDRVEMFKANLIKLVDLSDESKSEEFNKGLLTNFLTKTYYEDKYFINVKENSDLVIHNDKDVKSTAGVIFETKKPTKTGSVEMPNDIC
ncbi:hypothetical protein HCU40_05195 [Pseudanabaena biceps]|nr:hypothetical protein [Pseudanabaena biceps]